MTNQQYEPTTDDILRCYMQRGGSEEEFNRWLATVEAAAEQRGAIKALRDAVNEDRMYNGISFFVPEEALLDRADRVEGTASDEND